MARVLVTPTVTASPAGGGTVAYANAGEGSFPYMPDNAYRFYTYSATPSQGYTFSHFAITVTYVRNGTTTTNTVRQTGPETAGTWVYEAIDNSGGFGYAYMGYAFWYLKQASGEPDDIQVISIAVVAVFARIPTHLLVNSSTAINPVVLVYDDATDLLVVDA